MNKNDASVKSSLIQRFWNVVAFIAAFFELLAVTPIIMNMKDSDNNKLSTLLSVMRVQHWVKNGFVIAPLLFSKQFYLLDKCLLASLAFISFCAISSAIYIINDLCDRNEDRQHPTKKNRPIAAGVVGTLEAILLSVILMALSLVLAGYVGWRLLLLTAIYGALNIGYSLGIKHIAILDVMTIAAGFVLRILAGSVAISVEPSHWLVLCTIMISMFLGFTKRRSELVGLSDSQGNSRLVLKDYSVSFLDQAIAMVTAATIICYALYTVDARTVTQVVGTRAMLFTVPSVMYGLFRYIYIIYHFKKGEDPTQTLIHDVPTIINLIIWVAISILVVNYGSMLDFFN